MLSHFRFFDKILMIFVVLGLLVKNLGYVEKFWMNKLVSGSIPEIQGVDPKIQGVNPEIQGMDPEFLDENSNFFEKSWYGVYRQTSGFPTLYVGKQFEPLQPC